MQTETKAIKARAALNDEIVVQAFEETLAKINKELLTAQSIAEREERWHQYHALKRAWCLLKRWPHEATEN